ncbi:MAG: TCR/Tet family MFS transporter [Pseudomonadota bacterium]
MSETPAPQSTPTKPAGKNAFMFVLVCVFIDMVAFGLIFPVLPSLLSELTGDSVESAARYGGFLAAIYALMNFLAGPTIGGLSDRFGRRPVLLASMGTLCVDFLIMGFAGSVVVLFIGRMLSGISGATFSTANAYIADTTTPEARGKAFGMIGAAFGLGFIIGPVLGGVLGQIDPRAPFFAAAGLALVNMVYGYFVLPESLPPEKRRPFEWTRANPFGAFQHFSKIPNVGWLLLALGVFGLAHTVYPAIWSYHGEYRYGWTPAEIGLSLGFVGLISAVVQGGLTGVVMKRFGAAKTAMIGLSFNVLAFVGFAFAGTPWLAYAWTLISGFGGFTGPAFNTLISTRTPQDAQGELQGAAASIQSLAAIISPIMMTQTFYAFSGADARVHFPGAAFLLAGILCAVAAIPFLVGLRYTGTPPATDTVKDAA